jgi:hypothetical protein
VSEKKKGRGGRPPAKQNLMKHPLAHSLLKELAMRGATDAECAARMLVGYRTWCRWKASNKEYWQSLSAKVILDDESVEAALLESARGFTKMITKVEDGAVTVEERYYPPNVAATAFYLKNRKPDKWRDKIDIAASMEQIPVRINFKRKEKAVVDAESSIIPERKELENGQEDIGSGRQEGEVTDPCGGEGQDS